ncbi:MAG: hypothetical protein FWD68_21875 [Alphaproteobacteria bacterium]|nr:hypothetical protein [Alphaproteobacteria bacterium]
MTMEFRMKVADLFRAGTKTVFTGEVHTQAKVIKNASCVIEIDGVSAGELYIEGEVNTGRPYHDLWTTSPVNLTREVVLSHDVWLISS